MVFLVFVNVVNYIDFQMLNQSCILDIYIDPTWSWYSILLLYFWIWFASILRIFFVHEEYWWYNFPVSFSAFGIKVILALKCGVRCSSISILWKNFCKISINSSLSICQNSLMTPSGLGVFFMGRFWLGIQCI